MVDLLLLRSLLAVAQHGAVTNAAAALGLTQPALSRRIHQLEDELGAPLFERSRKGVALTEMGRLVRDEATELVARYERLRERVGAHVRLEAGTVRLGGGATAVAYLVPDAIAAFQREHARVTFQVKEAGSREIEDDVRRERLELGIVTREGGGAGRRALDDLGSTPLVEDDIVLVCPRRHPLARVLDDKGAVGLAALAGQALVGFEAGSAIRLLVDRALADAGVAMNVVMELRSIPAILQMAVTTSSLAFVSRLGLRGSDRRVRVLPVRGLRLRRQLSVVWKRGRPLSPASAAFARVLELSRAGRAGTRAPTGRSSAGRRG